MLTLRVNTRKTTREDILAILKEKKIAADPVGWIPEAIIIPDASPEQITSLPAYELGQIVIQNISSMLPTLLLDLQQYDSVLDMCAAPGVKTSHVATCLGPDSEIIANDVSRPRLYKLKDLLGTMDIDWVQTNLGHGEFLWRKYTDHFDKVLVDVPCSMGQEYHKRNLKRLMFRQRALLRSALACVKPGGRVVYSTCTNTTEENQKVVEWALKKIPEAKLIPAEIPGLPDEFYTPEGYLSIPEKPPFGMFFVAVFEKNQSDTDMVY